jgi:DNA ligase-1
MSAAMILECQEPMQWHVVDNMTLPGGFAYRYKTLPLSLRLEHVTAHSQAELDTFEALQISLGYEGVITRHPDAPYKHGRSTSKEQGMVKIKRFDSAEATIISVQELMHNNSALKESPLGFTERQHLQADQVPGDTLGALVCITPDGVVFNIGTGFTERQRKELWLQKDTLQGKIVSYSYFNHGVVDAPRHPVFKCIRHPEDL